MKRFIFALLASSSLAHAAYYVECGTGLTDNDGELSFKEVVFKASSQDDDFSGRNSDVWSVALAGKWLANGKATAEVVGEGSKKTIQIVIASGTGFSQIGKRFDVVGMYKDFPRLDVFNVGGFAGGSKTGSYKCFTAND